MQNIITPKKKNPRRLAVDFVYSLNNPLKSGGCGRLENKEVIVSFGDCKDEADIVCVYCVHNTCATIFSRES